VKTNSQYILELNLRFLTFCPGVRGVRGDWTVRSLESLLFLSILEEALRMGSLGCMSSMSVSRTPGIFTRECLRPSRRGTPRVDSVLPVSAGTSAAFWCGGERRKYGKGITEILFVSIPKNLFNSPFFLSDGK